MGSDEPKRKRPRSRPEPEPPGDPLGGLYDFLPPPDPAKDAAAKVAAAKNHMTRPKLPPEDRLRVIFLDIDGVLLPVGSVETIVVDGVALPVRDTVRESDFRAAALGNLRSIVQQTAATIVLSSEWRRTESLRSSIAAVLKSQDIPVFRDTTPIFHPKPELVEVHPVVAWCERRAREIGKWLKDHPEVTSWVALDDLDFAWADQVRTAGTPWMKVRSVLTDKKNCLTEEDGQEAVRIILNPPPDPKVQPKRPVLEDTSSSGSNLLCSTEDSAPERLRLG
mmetsp:Transcript_78435/g.229977  ORF Transcript_78435/g.229977 Transcript_78435/m.229977 type:complete len:279 (+) Transcript_78435:108-944(+)